MRHLNAIAGVLALLIVLALGGWWLSERLTPHPTPRFDAARFATVTAPRETLQAGGERWLVAVNPGCPHCREHLALLASPLAHRSASGPPPLLSVLVVDWPKRPTAEAEELSRLAPGGVWWDSARVWRGEWKHGAYAEVLVFDAQGRYRTTHGSEFLPETSASH
jgi:hypothetical protein